MYNRLTINPDGGERFAYNALDFPVYTGEGNLSSFYQYAVGCHWHRDFEFLLANRGDTDYFVNGTIVHALQGQCVFVNSNRLHYNFSRDRKNCQYSILVFHPSVLGELPLPTVRYALELGMDSQSDYTIFDAGNENGAEAIDLVRSICQACDRSEPMYELLVQSACGQLIKLLRMNITADSRLNEPDPAWTIIRDMTGYIQENYAATIRLQNIAAAGAVCKSKCCRLFKDYLRSSPNEYLTRYRLGKANELLRSTSMTITDIAQLCGFDGGSYFAEIYRKVYGITPSEARSRQKG